MTPQESKPQATLDWLGGTYAGSEATRSPTAGTMKEASFVLKTREASLQLNPPYRVGEIIFDYEIPCGDEIRLDGGWVDLISSEAMPKISSALADFILA